MIKSIDRQPNYFFSRLILNMLCGCFFFLSWSSHAQTLTDAVRIAMSQYPTILAAQARAQAADSDITRAQSGHWPQLGWQGTNSSYSDIGTTPFAPGDSWIQSPAVTMNIWSGWKIESGVERAEAIFDSQRQQQRITRDEVAFLATEAYLNWARSTAVVQLAKANLLAHERLYQDVVKIAQVDIGRQIDVEQAQVRLENAKLSLEQRKSEQEIVSQRLRRMLLGQLPRQPMGFDEVKGKLPANVDQALSYLNDTHPVIAQRLSRIEAAEASVRLARSGFSPTVNLSYQKQTTQGTGQGDYITQLNVNIPIFDGGSAYGSTKSAQSELIAVNQELTEAKITIKENLLAAWSEYASAKQRSIVGQNQVKSAKKLVIGYEQQFRVGRRSLLDLLTIQDNLYSYETNATNARFEQLIFKAKILAIVNQLAVAYQFHDNQTSTSTRNQTNESTSTKAMAQTTRQSTTKFDTKASSSKPFSNNQSLGINQ